VESQKIPIFSVAGEPYYQLLPRIGIPGMAKSSSSEALN